MTLYVYFCLKKVIYVRIVISNSLSIIAEGTPEKVAKTKGSYTGKFLAMELAG
jgi:hypothetical protein